jgi:meso-butanediol dehydrogenase/(S,S)-butanediol dehydrogenase/diacetyl reductase
MSWSTTRPPHLALTCAPDFATDLTRETASHVSGSARSLELSEEIWDANVSLALKSVYLVTRAVLPRMLSNKSGVIINIASVNGQTGLGEEAYSAAKAGVINLTENLAVRYGPSGIRACAVSPGTISSPAWAERLKRDPETLTTLQKHYALGRIGKPEDVANAVYFLSSEEAAWITGITLRVDGGLLAGSSALQRDLVPP